MLSKLILGTAQLGLEYGIANKTGKPDKLDAFKILDMALKYGINTFDTSPLYGNSEKIIGEFFKNNLPNKPVVITKLPPKELNSDLDFFINKKITESLNNLNLEIIPFYLIHNSIEVFDKEIIKALMSCKNKGLISQIGASVYTLEEANVAIDNGLSLLQIPVNIFDHRFLSTSFLRKCRENNVTLMARSVFLQGLLFYDPDNLPFYLSYASEYLERVNSICRKENISVSELALKYVCSFPEIKGVIIGAETPRQLENNIEAVSSGKLPESILKEIEYSFKSVPQTVTDPRYWKR